MDVLSYLESAAFRLTEPVELVETLTLHLYQRQGVDLQFPEINLPV